MIINPTNDSDQFEDNFDLTSTGIILTNPTTGTSQFIGNFNIQTETEASIANPTNLVSGQFADNFNLPDTNPQIGIGHNPTISTSQQFADNFNLPDTNPTITVTNNPTTPVSGQFADNFNLPDAPPTIVVANNPTTTNNSQFNDNFPLTDTPPTVTVTNNPTTTNNGQFADNFDLPDTNPTVTVTNNPTNGDELQFQVPFDLIPTLTETAIVTNNSNPTTTSTDQFQAPFDLIPTLTETNIVNPTTDIGQFADDFDLTTTTETNITNPTNPVSGQFADNFNLPDTNPQIGIKHNPTFMTAGFSGKYQNFDNDTTTETNIAANNPNPTTAFNQIGVKPLQETIPPDFSPIGNIEPASKVAPNIHTNQNADTYGSDLIRTAVFTGAGILGIPQVAQSALAALRYMDTIGSAGYTTSPMDKLTLRYPAKSGTAGERSYFPAAYVDFRSRNGTVYLQNMRLDGTSAAIRNLVYGAYSDAIKPGIYAASNVAAALSPIPIGPYSLFNLDGTWKSGYGWGSHDARFALRSDFTLQSQVARSFKNNTDATLDKSPDKDHKTMILNQIFPFRGDRVNVIDYGKRVLNRAMNWRPSPIAGVELPALFSDTQDFIKFYFTGPKLYNGNPKDIDDIIVFRAALNSLTDSFNANWNTVNMIGRADPNYQYTGYSRDVNLGFNVVATDRDELRVIYRKLNALAGYTAPTYNESSIAMEAPWLRLTVGDVFQQTPVVLNTLSYTFETELPWEINIENDFEMMQAPLHVSVTCGFNIIGDSIPQKTGRFYGFAKLYNKDTGQPILGRGNWLSDSKISVPSPVSGDNAKFSAT